MSDSLTVLLLLSVGLLLVYLIINQRYPQLSQSFSRGQAAQDGVDVTSKPATTATGAATGGGQDLSAEASFEKLLQVARATTEGVQLEVVLQQAVNITTTLTNAEKGSLILLDEANSVRHSILSRGETPPGKRQKILRDVLDHGVAGWVARRQTSVLINDTELDERWHDFPDAPYQARSVLAVPLMSHNELLGVLTLQHAQRHHFTAKSQMLMEAAAGQMALAVRNAQTFERQRRLAERQTILYQVLSTISNHLAPHTVVETAVSTIATLTDWPALAILVPDETQNIFIIQAAEGLLANAAAVEFSLDIGVSGRAYRTGQTQIVPDLRRDPDNFSAHPRLLSSINIPMRQGERIVGIFAVEQDRVNGFDQDDIWLAKALAEAVTLAMKNARLFQSTKDEHGRLQALIQASQDGIVLVGVDQKILVINQMTLHLLQLPGQPGDWVGRPLLEALFLLRRHAPDGLRTALKEFRRVLSGDREQGEGELTLSPHILHWFNLPVQADTKPIGRLLLIRDVTNERMLEHMRDDLTHTTVHDLRNPIGAVHTALDFLHSIAREEKFSNDTLQVIDIAQHNVNKSMRLVNDLLDISRLESHQMPLQYQAFSLRQVVAMTLRAQQQVALHKAINLHQEVSESLPLAWADQELVERVLQNLVGNALKFTPEGGDIWLTATARYTSRGFRLQISVSDTGPGIAPDIQKRLFQKFATGRQVGRGSGLGLAFCRMVMEAHHERIWVAQTGPTGTTILFTLMSLPAANGEVGNWQVVNGNW
jgi:signal transduction histidine kinase/putative methionine-R-sulfoxide reductase with GAF domain